MVDSLMERFDRGVIVPDKPIQYADMCQTEKNLIKLFCDNIDFTIHLPPVSTFMILKLRALCQILANPKHT